MTPLTHEVPTHGSVELASGSSLIAEYVPGDVGPGWLSLTLMDPLGGELAGRLRVDPWDGGSYRLFDWSSEGCFVLCGGETIVTLHSSTLSFISSIDLLYEEGEMLREPRFIQVDKELVIATEYRVWCLYSGGNIKWMWNAPRGSLIASKPITSGKCVSVHLTNLERELAVDLSIGDGMPIGERAIS